MSSVSGKRKAETKGEDDNTRSGKLQKTTHYKDDLVQLDEYTHEALDALITIPIDVIAQVMQPFGIASRGVCRLIGEYEAHQVTFNGQAGRSFGWMGLATSGVIDEHKNTITQLRIDDVAAIQTAVGMSAQQYRTLLLAQGLGRRTHSRDAFAVSASLKDLASLFGKRQPYAYAAEATYDQCVKFMADVRYLDENEAKLHMGSVGDKTCYRFSSMYPGRPDVGHHVVLAKNEFISRLAWEFEALARLYDDVQKMAQEAQLQSQAMDETADDGEEEEDDEDVYEKNRAIQYQAQRADEARDFGMHLVRCSVCKKRIGRCRCPSCMEFRHCLDCMQEAPMQRKIDEHVAMCQERIKKCFAFAILIALGGGTGVPP